MAGLKIRTGDHVQVLTGKDRGKRGTVSQVFPDDAKVIVDGVNTAKKHAKARSADQPGGIVSMDMPVPVSNVGVVCDACGAPTRVGYSWVDGRKVRVCRKCGGEL